MFEEYASAVPSSIWASMNSWFTPTVLFVLLNLMIGTIAFTSSLANKKHQNQQQENPQPHHHHQQQPKLARSPSVLQRLRSLNLYNYRSQETQPFTTHFYPNPDSNTLFNFQTTHQDQIHESQSHLIYPQPHQDRQNLEPDPTQSIFQQTHEENPPENQSQYDFELAHQEIIQNPETDNDFDLQQGLEEDDEGKHDEVGELKSLDEVYSQLTNSHVTRSNSDTKPAAGEIPAKLPAKMRKSASLKSAFGHFEEEEIVEVRRPATAREKATVVDDEVDAKADDFINRFKQQLKLQRLDSILRYKEVIGRGTGK